MREDLEVTSEDNGVYALADFSAAVADRVKLLESNFIQFEKGGYGVYKPCLFHVLPILEGAEDFVRSTFALELFEAQPSEVPCLRDDSYLEPRSKAEDFELIKLVKALGYQGGNPEWDQQIHYIVDQGVEVTTDSQFIFNLGAILQYLDISEIREMRRVSNRDKGLGDIADARVEDIVRKLCDDAREAASLKVPSIGASATSVGTGRSVGQPPIKPEFA